MVLLSVVDEVFVLVVFDSVQVLEVKELEVCVSDAEVVEVVSVKEVEVLSAEEQQRCKPRNLSERHRE